MCALSFFFYLLVAVWVDESTKRICLFLFFLSLYIYFYFLSSGAGCSHFLNSAAFHRIPSGVYEREGEKKNAALSLFFIRWKTKSAVNLFLFFLIILDFFAHSKALILMNRKRANNSRGEKRARKFRSIEEYHQS